MIYKQAFEIVLMNQDYYLNSSAINYLIEEYIEIRMVSIKIRMVSNSFMINTDYD